MFGLGTPELIVVLGIAFLVFGGKKIPEIGAGLGKGIRAFRKGIQDVEATGKAVVDDAIPGAKEISAIKKDVEQAAEAVKLAG